LPVLLRDSQVLPIWEGTTNVLALDTLRALRGAEGLKQFESEVLSCVENVRDPHLANAGRIVRSSLDHAASWLAEAQQKGEPALEAGARRFSLTLGRTMELALLIKHAQWSIDHEQDGRALSSAHRFALAGIDSIWTEF
jgi:hypothetical protein